MTLRPPEPLRRLAARPWARPALGYAAAVAALWPVPVFGVLHAESSAVVAAVAFFVSAVAGVGAFERGERIGHAMRRSVALLAVPLAGLTLSLLWRPNCAYLTGLGLFGVLVPPSAILGTALAAALVAFRVRRPRLVAVLVGVAVAAGGTVWSLGFHPQLFVYNPVYGGVLGPIYDEELTIRAGLFVARAQTLVWAGVLVAVARWRGGGGGTFVVLGATGLAVLGAAAVFSVPLGVHQSADGIERVLRRRAVDGRIVVHVARETLAPEARAFAETAAFRLDQIEARLGARARGPVHVYLYPDEETKGRLIGSRQTSVVPTWLARPQVHMLEDEVERSLGHELAHVVAREFGMAGIRASPNVGLVEGLAVAVEPPDGLPAPEALVAAALTLPGDAGGLDTDPAAVVRQAMSPVGFWGGRAAVSYTATGAFVAWLARTRGVAVVREAYRTGDVAGATGVSVEALSEAWAAHIHTVAVSPEAQATAAWLFRQPSLFEVACPHHVPRYVRATRAGFDALDAGDAPAAFDRFERALADRKDHDLAQAGWVAAYAAGGGRATPRAPVRLGYSPGDSVASALELRARADFRRLLWTESDSFGLALIDTLYARSAQRLAPTDAAGRLSLRLRSRLSASALRVVFSHPGDPGRAAAASERGAPFFSARLYDEASEPVRAWTAIRRVSAAGLPTDERGALRLVASRLAYRAGGTATAGRLAGLAETDLRASGADALARVAADWRVRVRWRQARDANRTANRASHARVSP